MGLLFSHLAEAIPNSQSESPSKILMLGLDAAGKTTILYKVMRKKIGCAVPVEFNVEMVTPVDGVTFAMWDVGGQERIRAHWNYYYSNSQGLLFIVDSADTSRLGEAREELSNVIKDPEMQGVPVVVMANKQDLPGAASTAEVADKLGLRDMRDRKWHVQGACATNGEGIYEGMHEMARLVKEFQKTSR